MTFSEGATCPPALTICFISTASFGLWSAYANQITMARVVKSSVIACCGHGSLVDRETASSFDLEVLHLLNRTRNSGVRSSLP